MDTPSPAYLGRADVTNGSHADPWAAEPSLFAWTRKDLTLENALLFIAVALAVFLPVPPIGGTIAFGLAAWSAYQEHWAQMSAALLCTVYSTLPSLGVFVLVVSSGS